MKNLLAAFAALSISALAAPAYAECSPQTAPAGAQPNAQLAAQQSGQQADNGGFFVADSFSFGVEREMKESGEKGGTADINIGVGELQECSISKSSPSARPAKR